MRGIVTAAAMALAVSGGASAQAPRQAQPGPTQPPPIPTRIMAKTLSGLCAQDRNVCMTYVLGSADAFAAALVAAGRPQVFCIPRGTTNEQVAQSAVRYVRARPQEGNSNAALVILSALQASYPCGF